MNVVDVYVGYVRGKLARLARQRDPMVLTVRGRGFLLRPPL
jgi:DNA-binding response OmpR family regulator